MIGSRRPPATASGTASRIWGTTCLGVTQLMLWQPCAWSCSIIWASRAAVTRSPWTSQEMSWCWQNTQRRLQPEKKIVPEPFQPRRAVLLAKVRKGGRDHGLAADGAQPLVVGQAVHLTQGHPRARRYLAPAATPAWTRLRCAPPGAAACLLIVDFRISRGVPRGRRVSAKMWSGCPPTPESSLGREPVDSAWVHRSSNGNGAGPI